MLRRKIGVAVTHFYSNFPCSSMDGTGHRTKFCFLEKSNFCRVFALKSAYPQVEYGLSTAYRWLIVKAMIVVQAVDDVWNECFCLQRAP